MAPIATLRHRGPLSRPATKGPRPRLAIGARLRVLLFAPGLDRRLADGSEPGASRALALHAARISTWDARCALADRLEATMDGARKGPFAFGAAVPVGSAQLGDARRTLDQVCTRLRSTRPVRPRGVALLRLLLTDPAAPLYSARDDGSLDSWLQFSLKLLDQLT